MHQELLIAVLAGLGGMLGWGLADFFAKKTIDDIGSVASLAWAHIFGTLIIGAFAVYQMTILGKNFTVPHDPATWGGLIFFGVLQAIVYLLVYIGFSKGQLA